MGVKLPTVTIGIPAYNEAANISQLLQSLLDQNQCNYRLVKIIVASDASSDQTNELVKQFESQKVVLLSGRQRKGQAYRQNQIFEKSTSDIVVLLNADILPHDNTCIEALVKPLIKDKRIGLVSGHIVPTKSPTAFGRMLDWHMSWKNNLYRSINNQENVYLCHGRARAFSRALYTKLRWPQIWSEDAYSYLAAKEYGFTFAFAAQAKIWYQSPTHLRDHIRQSIRFFQNKPNLTQYFPPEYVEKAFALPRATFVKHLLKGLVQHPRYTSWYLAVLAYSLCHARFPKLQQLYLRQAWEPSVSTKVVSI